MVSIFPTPKKLDVKDGVFALYNVGIYVDNSFDYRVKKAALKLREIISESTGKPVALNLRLENEFKNDGIELALFTCECLDEEGRVVPDAAEYVTFSVSNPAVIVGTGSDNTDPLNVTNPSRQMFMGKISVAVRPKKDQESFELVAQAKNLKTKIIKINCK